MLIHKRRYAGRMAASTSSNEAVQNELAQSAIERKAQAVTRSDPKYYPQSGDELLAAASVLTTDMCTG